MKIGFETRNNIQASGVQQKKIKHFYIFKGKTVEKLGSTTVRIFTHSSMCKHKYKRVHIKL